MTVLHRHLYGVGLKGLRLGVELLTEGSQAQPHSGYAPEILYTLLALKFRDVLSFEFLTNSSTT